MLARGGVLGAGRQASRQAGGRAGGQAGRRTGKGAGAAPGGVELGGYMTHFLDPRMTAFQAEVEFGSLWNVDPERAGPMISHLGPQPHSR